MSEDKAFAKALQKYEASEVALATAKKELQDFLKDRQGQLVKVNGIPHRVSKRDMKNEAKEIVGVCYFLRSLVSQEALDAMRTP